MKLDLLFTRKECFERSIRTKSMYLRIVIGQGHSSSSLLQLKYVELWSIANSVSQIKTSFPKV